MAFVKIRLHEYICQKTGNKSTGTTLSMLKINLRCLIYILKVKYTEIKISYFTTFLFA